MSRSYSSWPPPTWHTPQDFAKFDGLISICLFAAAAKVSVPPLSTTTSFAANWRFEGGQYLPHMPGELVNAGAPQMDLSAAVHPSFLPCWLCFPVETPCAGDVTV